MGKLNIVASCGGNGMDPIGREGAFAVLVGSEFSKFNKSSIR